MEQTLTKVKNLEKFIKKYGEDVVISQTITKMLDYKIRQYDEEIKKLHRALSRFERKHKKESAAFFQEFKKGALGDEMDFIEWASLYQMRNRLMEKKSELEKNL
jgi:predicted RNase H-like nuclease (RuvC/YqgF family)